MRQLAGMPDRASATKRSARIVRRFRPAQSLHEALTGGAYHAIEVRGSSAVRNDRCNRRRGSRPSAGMPARLRRAGQGVLWQCECRHARMQDRLPYDCQAERGRRLLARLHRHFQEGEGPMPHEPRELSRRLRTRARCLPGYLRPGSRDVHQGRRGQAAGLHPDVQNGIRSSCLRVVVPYCDQGGGRRVRRVVPGLPGEVQRVAERRLRRAGLVVVLDAADRVCPERGHEPMLEGLTSRSASR